MEVDKIIYYNLQKLVEKPKWLRYFLRKKAKHFYRKLFFGNIILFKKFKATIYYKLSIKIKNICQINSRRITSEEKTCIKDDLKY
ncbi:hypothetical protein pb186bvf_011770 [Paramecium bursaria]